MLRICLIVAHELLIRDHMRRILEAADFQCLGAESAPQAYRMVRALNGSLDVVVADVDIPGDMGAQDLAYAIHASYPALPVVLMCGPKSLQETRRIQKEFPLLERSLLPEAVVRVIQSAMARVEAAGA